MTIDLDPTQTLAAAILVLFLGSFVLARIGFLRNNNIPVPVVGGILFAVLTSVLYARFDTQISFDMALKDPMMLIFFSTIGLTADVRRLRRGGPQLLLFAGVCLAYLTVQNGLGVLASHPESEMIVFGPRPPAEVKHTVTVFTDVDCGYCAKLHREMAGYNELGIEVRYMAFPRAGVGSNSYRKIVSVWCAEDQQDAMTRALWSERGRQPWPVCGKRV